MKTSAGLLMFQRRTNELEILLAHPGGPFYRNKDEGAWTLPKGELAEGEDARVCALREFREETGIDPNQATLLSLGEIRQKGGKRVLAWAFEAPDTAIDLALLPPSNTFEMEWPPRSGKLATFPEVDRLQFFGVEEARRKILASQLTLIDRLIEALR